MAYPINTRDPWKYVQIPNLLGGINTSRQPSVLDNSETVRLNNVLAADGKLLNDTGYKMFSTTVVGIPQTTVEFRRRDLTTDLIGITTSTVYKYSVSLNAWILLKGTAGTTTTSAYASGISVIAVASAAGFTTGDLVGITLDNGSQLQTTITVSGLDFTLADAIPASRSVASGAAVIRAVVLSGSVDAQVSTVIIPGSDWLVFTNGIDIVKRFDGTDCIDVPGLPSGGSVVCNAVALYNSALFLLGTVEGGVNYKQRARRSDQTDPTNWTTGTSGYDDLLDSSDSIKCGVLLGPYLIVYRDHSIARGSFIGAGGINYFFETMVSGDGAISTNAVVDTGQHHIFVGHNNVYEYHGDYNAPDIGGKIFKHLFGNGGELNPSTKHRVTTVFVDELNEFWLAYPTTLSSDGNCNDILRYNITDKFWYSREFANNLVGFGSYTASLVKTWNDLVGSWTAQSWAWNSATVQSNSRTIHICAVDSNVYEYDYISPLDNASAISYTIETKDFTSPDELIRFDMLEMFFKGTNTLVEYSTDGGDVWNTLDTISSTNQERVRLYKQIVTNRIRFRISGSDAGFVLEWIGISYKAESVY